MSDFQIKKCELLGNSLVDLDNDEIHYFFNQVEKNSEFFTSGLFFDQGKVDSLDGKGENYLQEKEELRKLLENEEIVELLNIQASSGGGASQEVVEEEEVVEQTEFDVVVKGFDAKSKLKVIKEVKLILGIGLKDAKDKVEGAPFVIQEKLSKEDSEALKEKLEKLKCEIEIK